MNNNGQFPNNGGHHQGQGFPNQNQQFNNFQNQPPFQNNNQQQQNNNDNYFLNNPYNQNSYEYIDEESMEDFYNHKKSKTKMIILIVLSIVFLTFILGVFTTPFINGTPKFLNEQAREVLDYTEEMKNKTFAMFKRDNDYYDFFKSLNMNTSSSGIMTDSQLSSEISNMDKLISQLETMSKAKQVPPGFDGPGGLHEQLIALLKQRTKRLNDLRNITQGQGKSPKEFSEDFKKYLNARNNVLRKYNAKYEVNFKKVLFDMKELEF